MSTNEIERMKYITKIQALSSIANMSAIQRSTIL